MSDARFLAVVSSHRALPVRDGCEQVEPAIQTVLDDLRVSRTVAREDSPRDLSFVHSSCLVVISQTALFRANEQ